jgi:hypothetical protein
MTNSARRVAPVETDIASRHAPSRHAGGGRVRLTGGELQRREAIASRHTVSASVPTQRARKWRIRCRPRRGKLQEDGVYASPIKKWRLPERDGRPSFPINDGKL